MHKGTSPADAAATPKKNLSETRGAPALFTKDVMHKLESAIAAESGIARRAALGVLTMSGSELIAKIEQDRDSAVAFAALQHMTTEYIAKLEELLHWMHVAQARLLVALANRADVATIMAEGKTSSRKDHPFT